MIKESSTEKVINYAKKHPKTKSIIVVSGPETLEKTAKEIEQKGTQIRIKKYAAEAKIEFKNGSTITIIECKGAEMLRGQVLDGAVKIDDDCSEEQAIKILEEIVIPSRILVSTPFDKNSFFYTQFKKKVGAEWIPDGSKKGKPLSAGEPQQS